MKNSKRIPIKREPLTKKARQAIRTYTAIEGEKVHHMQWFMIDIVLKAERMRRSQLYAILQRRGYRWTGQMWMKKA